MRQLKISQQITSRESESVAKYFNEVSKEKLLTPDEEIALTTLIYETGDEQAKQKLIKANLRFVISVAKQYQGAGLKLEDLISEGNIGLMKAVDRFDPTRGFKFISFAVWWIRQQIMYSIDTKGKQIYIPGNRVTKYNQIRRESAKLEQELQREPEPHEIAEFMGLDEDYIIDLLSKKVETTSSDSPVGQESGAASLSEFLENTTFDNPDSSLYSDSIVTEFKKLMQKILPPIQLQVAEMFLGVGKPQMSINQIALELEMQPNQVRSIRDYAIKKLRKNKKCQSLLQYY